MYLNDRPGEGWKTNFPMFHTGNRPVPITMLRNSIKEWLTPQLFIKEWAFCMSWRPPNFGPLKNWNAIKFSPPFFLPHHPSLSCIISDDRLIRLLYL